MYALGVTLFHALIGSPPFPTSDRARTLELHRTAAPPRPGDLLRGVPVQLENLLMRMLSKLPTERHPSYAALIAELRAIPLA
jgi:serine/threonine-protein kinase